MKACSQACKKNDVSCSFQECKFWVDYEEDYNCCLISIDKHGPMKLRQIADRIGVSYVRVKHIQDVALVKLSKFHSKEELLCILPD